MKRPVPDPAAFQKDAIRLRRAGLSVMEICRELRCARFRVEPVLAEAGLFRPRVRASADKVQQRALELHARGVLPPVIATEIGCAVSTVRMILRNAGALQNRDHEVTPAQRDSQLAAAEARWAAMACGARYEDAREPAWTPTRIAARRSAAHSECGCAAAMMVGS